MGKKTQKKKVIKELALFLIKFNILLIPYYAIIYFDISFYSLQAVFANLIAAILKIFSYNVTISDFFLFVGEQNLPIDMSRDCIGWKSAYSLLALVIAAPGKFKNKLKFLGFWIPILLLINVFRVVMIIIIGLNFGIKYLEITHTFIWQELMIIIVIGIWYFWLKKNVISKI